MNSARNLALLFLATLLVHCSTKKAETTQSAADTVAVDSVLATAPAPSTLAFSAFDAFSLESKVEVKDTVKYYLFTNQDEMKAALGAIPSNINPDFQINHIVAVACAPNKALTKIVIDRVETAEDNIDVYLTIRRGEDQKAPSKPVRIFAIERRDGFVGMQFYVNGKKGEVLMLPMQ